MAAVVVVPLLICVAFESIAFPDKQDNTLLSWVRSVKARSGSAASPVAMSSCFVGDDGKHLIRFRFTNTSAAPLKLWPFQLPWGNPNSIDLFAITTDGVPIPTGNPIADPAEEQIITIEPGETVQGDFDLDGRIVSTTSLSTVLRRSDIFVVWSYSLSCQDRNFVANTGAILIPKKP
jgi:hypothetical protein